MPTDGFPSGTIVVTGAAGMIGSHLLLELGRAGCRIVACDHVPQDARASYHAGVAIEAWIAPGDLPEWLDRHARQVSAILHMGAISDTTETRLDLLSRNNVEFTLDLWRRSARHGWKFLYASSAATYGSGRQGFVDGDDLAHLETLKPLNPYGCSKHQADCQMVADWRSGLATPPVWAGFKFFNVYGPNEEHKGAMRSVVRKVMEAVERGEPVRLFRSNDPHYRDGEQLRDFIYVKDAIRPVLRALRMDDLAGLFNVGTGQARTFLDLVRASCTAMAVPLNIEFIDMPAAICGQYQNFTEADVTKATAHGLQAVEYSLELGVADYVAQLKTQAGGVLHVAV